MSEVKKELPAELERQLMELGLTSYQARVYRAVFILQECSISQIANYSKVPTAKIYAVVIDLKEMGLLAEIPTSRPAMYKAYPPDQYIQHEINRVAEIGEQIRNNLKLLEKFKKDEIPTQPQTLLIENELLIKNMVLKEVKEISQQVLFILHQDFDFYEEVLLQIQRVIKSATELKIKITVVDPYDRIPPEFLEKFKDLKIQTIKYIDLSTDFMQTCTQISFLFILDDKVFINISQVEQNLGYLFIQSQNFSEFLYTFLKELKRTA